MRVSLPGVSRPENSLRLLLDGEELAARPGDSVASAMIAAGHHRFRKGSQGDDRGLFCGMGVCGECQILVDGVSTRACLEKVRDGMTLQRHPARRPLPDPGVRAGATEWPVRTPDVLVVGAGPAGLSAAVVAARSGLDVCVVDERPQPGGQYFKQPSDEAALDGGQLDSQFQEGRNLIASALAAGIKYLPDAVAWGSFDGPSIAITAAGITRIFKPRRIVLSPGSYERPVTIPGWTLPGVMTTGALQTQVRAYGTAPDGRILIAGNGPLNFQLASELVRARAGLVSIVEAASSPVRASLQFAKLVLNGPRLAMTGMRHMATVLRAGSRVLFGRALIRVDETDGALATTVAELDRSGNAIPGSETRDVVDTVCMNYGFLPQSELARSLGCNFMYDHRTCNWTAYRDATGRTNVPEVFLVGDAGGMGGAQIAMDQGALAGYEIARDLGGAADTAGVEARGLRRRLRRHKRFQAALWSLFKAPVLVTQHARPDTVICRCEGITLGQLHAALSDSCHSLAWIKKTTRAGMGRCQGRYCGVNLATIIADAGYGTPDADAFFAPRPPFKPLPLGQLAGSYGDSPTAQDLLSTSGRYANI